MVFLGIVLKTRLKYSKELEIIRNNLIINLFSQNLLQLKELN